MCDIYSVNETFHIVAYVIMLCFCEAVLRVRWWLWIIIHTQNIFGVNVTALLCEEEFLKSHPMVRAVRAFHSLSVMRDNTRMMCYLLADSNESVNVRMEAFVGLFYINESLSPGKSMRKACFTSPRFSYAYLASFMSNEGWRHENRGIVGLKQSVFTRMSMWCAVIKEESLIERDTAGLDL